MIHIWFVIHSLPSPLTNTPSFYVITQQERLSLTYWAICGDKRGTLCSGDLRGPRYSTHVEIGRFSQSVGALCTVTPQKAALWKTAKLERLEDVKRFPLKGICERRDQLKFHLSILLNHCSIKKCDSSLYAVLGFCDMDFCIPNIRNYERLYLF